MVLSGVLIADLHIGSINSIRLKIELSKSLFSKLDSLMNELKKKIDFIIFLGDFWDKKFFLNDKEGEVGLWVINELRKYTDKIRILYGTESHEVDQYHITSIFRDMDDIDFDVIYNVKEEELFPNFNVLYIPEEYIYDKNEYYKEYFSNKNKYDYIFGHGVLAEAMTVSNSSSSKNETRLKPPIFTTADFKKCCKGEVYFGHYHIHTDINETVHYVGSFTRWEHGQEESKGYYLIEYDSEKKNPYSNTFIDNNEAKKYKTYGFSYSHKIFLEEKIAESSIQMIKNLITMNEGGNTRFLFNIPEEYPNPEFFMDTIRELLKGYKDVTFEFVNGYIEKKKKVRKEELESVVEKYGYLFDKNLSCGQIMSNFIKDKSGVEISGTDIDTYLNTDIMTLINNELDEENGDVK